MGEETHNSEASTTAKTQTNKKPKEIRKRLKQGS